jgi:hypothetical protein
LTANRPRSLWIQDCNIMVLYEDDVCHIRQESTNSIHFKHVLTLNFNYFLTTCKQILHKNWDLNLHSLVHVNLKTLKLSNSCFYLTRAGRNM